VLQCTDTERLIQFGTGEAFNLILSVLFDKRRVNQNERCSSHYKKRTLFFIFD
jgi:hypothetical protein